MQCITREPTCLTCSSLGEWYFPLSPAIEPSHSSSADDGRWSSDRKLPTQTMSHRRLGPTQSFKAAPFSNPTNSAGRLAGRCLACTRTGCTAWFSKRYFPISLHLAIPKTLVDMQLQRTIQPIIQKSSLSPTFLTLWIRNAFWWDAFLFGQFNPVFSFFSCFFRTPPLFTLFH